MPFDRCIKFQRLFGKLQEDMQEWIASISKASLIDSDLAEASAPTSPGGTGEFKKEAKRRSFFRKKK